MGNEIKLDLPEVEKAITKLKNATEVIKVSIPTNLTDHNNLDVTKKLNALNNKLNKLAEKYASSLNKQISQTEQLVRSMQETDEVLSKSITNK
ncbi:DUF5344 family protein [Bacillus subtilis]|uniref:DUF5344 family protein n=1 Tax=Bacillus subtilis TaxID=1423 RepID=UPI0020400950|nr:DUF5344 family protein [Bacillus subtilis]MCM3158742.1 YwqI/YxiC family protein [Bacillus subtilis]MCY8930558.1 YwqI/YxiC family protein [Bacillus subtilis]